MKRTLTTLFALSAAIFYGPLAQAQDTPEGPIVIRLYDFAGAPAAEIDRAKQEADAIFARSGIALSWLTCTLDENNTPADPTCNEVRGPSVLNLRLLPEKMAPSDLPNGIFGFSMMSTTGGFSSTTNVYVDRVTVIADGRKYRRPVVMGAIIAHELGHLMLGIGSHSKTGLMSLPWGPKALTAADRGALGFTKRESKQMQKATAARLSASAELLAAAR